jgi:LemA protein
MASLILLKYGSIGIIIILIMYTIVIYNNLIILKNNAKKSWSNIDVLLKQRHDELPKLVETCKQYMGFEQNTLQNITAARGQVMQALKTGDITALGQAESTLRTGLGNLFAVAENYPDLKTNHSFLQLQERISGLENTIADRRELYNDAVNLNNIRISQFPDVIIAKTFNFTPLVLLEFEADRADVNMQNLFSNK